jgi:hypothetical protein
MEKMMLFSCRRQNRVDGFSMAELLVAMLASSVMVAATVSFFIRQQKILVNERIVADVQSAGTIGFFLIGRDIRRAGSNPVGALGYDPGTSIPFSTALADRITILADINGDQDIDDEDENITYQHVDSDGDGEKDTVTRTAAGSSDIFIENVYKFELEYTMTGGGVTTTPSPTSAVKVVSITLGIQSDRLNPATGKPIIRDFQINSYMRNFE